jgi:hypothetical protein
MKNIKWFSLSLFILTAFACQAVAGTSLTFWHGIESPESIRILMGNDLYVHVSKDNHTFIARLAPDTQVKEETHHPMVFETRNCHLFDKQSGDNLTI